MSDTWQLTVILNSSCGLWNTDWALCPSCIRWQVQKGGLLESHRLLLQRSLPWGRWGQRSAYARFKKPKRAELFLLLNCEHNVDLAWPRPLPPLPHPRLLPCRLRCHVRCHAKKSLGQNTISSNHNVHVTGQECAATRWRQLCTCVCACWYSCAHVCPTGRGRGGGVITAVQRLHAVTFWEYI